MSELVSPAPNVGSKTITITLDGSWASASSVLTPTCPDNDSRPSCVGGYDVESPNGSDGHNPGFYSQGFEAAADVGTSSSSGSADNEVVAGFAPEPSTLILWGSGLLILGTISRKRLGRAV